MRFLLISDPRNAYSKLYTVGNVWGGRPVLCSSGTHSSFVVLANKSPDVNTEIENLKNAVVKVCFMASLHDFRPLEGSG